MHDKKNVSRLIKIAKGQLDGILKMLDENRDCLEICSQISASQSILKKVNAEILSSHLTHCVRESFERKNEEEINSSINEFAQLLNKILK